MVSILAALLAAAAAAPQPVIGEQAGEGADAAPQAAGERAGARQRLPQTGGAQAQIARLRLESRDGVVLAWVDNLLAGPIEVMLQADGPPPTAQPALPARATIPARGRILVARLLAPAGPETTLSLRAVPGHPATRPRDVEYGWPLHDRQLRITQGWGGRFSHQDIAERHAVDFAVPLGTPVLAARDGLVMQAEAGAGSAADSPGRANLVRILHDDGTMAVYAHLDADGLFVRPGEHVRRGQRIGLSGSTGFSSGPHLHFVVQVNRGMRLESIPFRMFGPGGILRFRDPDDAFHARQLNLPRGLLGLDSLASRSLDRIAPPSPNERCQSTHELLRGP